nr:RHS repeat-associated core domain-containing protein [Amycolatopsis thermoflava]
MEGATTTFTYDRNRLTSAVSNGVTAAYNYDPFGRLNTVTAAGQIIESYTYDGFDRTAQHKKLAPGTTNLTTTSYAYDPLDRTVTKTDNAGTPQAKTTNFAYLGLTDQVVTEEIGGQIQRSYAYDAFGQRLSQLKHDTDGTGPQIAEDAVYGYNPHSDVETLTTPGGDTRATYGYTAYGSNDEQAFTGIDKPDTQNPGKEPYNFYRYNGKRWDNASGSYDMGFRDYNPGLNRFLTRDSYNGALADLNLGTDPRAANRYSFTGGNPITRIELDGHRPEDEPGYCLGYQGDCGIDPTAGNTVRGEYSPEQLAGMGVLQAQQPHVGSYQLPNAKADYGALTTKAADTLASQAAAQGPPRNPLEELWRGAFAAEGACVELGRDSCSAEMEPALMADRAAIEEAFKQHSQGMSLTDALNVGIMAIAQMGIAVGSNRTGVVRGGVLKGARSAWRRIFGCGIRPDDAPKMEPGPRVGKGIQTPQWATHRRYQLANAERFSS